MSDTNRVALYLKKETTFGVAATGNYSTLRYTGESLNPNNESVTSDEIVSTGEISDITQVSIGAEGSIDFELSYGAYDDLFEYVIRAASTWAGTTTVTASDISAAAADNSYNSAGAGFGSIAAGSWIYVTGFTGDTANNGYSKVVTATASKLVVSGITLVNDSAGESVTIKESDSITNSTTLPSVSIEKKFGDLTNEFHLLTGMVVGGMSLRIASKEKITGSFNFVGKKYEVKTSTSAGTPVAATTASIQNAVSNIVYVYVGGLAAANRLAVKNIDFNVNVNPRARDVVATLGPESMGSGFIEVTGSLGKYFSASSTITSVFTGDTYTSFTVIFRDSAGNSYVIEVPSAKFTSYSANASGVNADVMDGANFRARKDPTAGHTIRIHRIAA